MTQKLGELNGRWVTSFKIALVGLVPLCGFVFSWLGWLSHGLIEARQDIAVLRQAAAGFETHADAVALRSDIENRINIVKLDSMRQFNDLPPQWFRDTLDKRLTAIEKSIETLRTNP